MKIIEILSEELNDINLDQAYDKSLTIILSPAER